MPVYASKKSKFEANYMTSGLHPAVAVEVVEKNIPSFDDKSVLELKIIVRFVNAEGQEASRFYSPDFYDYEKNGKRHVAPLLKDLRALGLVGKTEVPESDVDVEQLLLGRQTMLLVSENSNGKAKIDAVTKAPANQSVPVPEKYTKKAPAQAARPAATTSTQITDEDIPF